MERYSAQNLNNSFFTKRPRRTGLRSTLRLIYEEMSYCNVFEQLTLNGQGEELIGFSTFVC